MVWRVHWRGEQWRGEAWLRLGGASGGSPRPACPRAPWAPAFPRRCLELTQLLYIFLRTHNCSEARGPRRGAALRDAGLEGGRQGPARRAPHRDAPPGG